MPKFIGRRVSTGLGKEATWGTGVAPSHWIPHTALTFDDKATKAVSAEALGNISGMGRDSAVTQKWAEGDIEGEINANSFGLIMLSLFGADPGTSVIEAGQVWKHDWDTLINTNTHSSLSIYADDPVTTDDSLFRGSKVDSLNISAAPGEFVTFSSTFKGKPSAPAAQNASFSRDYKFIGANSSVRIAAAVGNLNAASDICLKSFEINFAKNLDDDFCLGTLEPDDLPNKQMVISGTLELDHQDRTYRDLMLDNTIRAMRFRLTGADTIGLGVQKSVVSFEFDRVHFEGWERDLSLDEIAKQTINFTVLYDLTNDRLWNDAYLQNTTSSY